jgi:hypothetical protein
MRERWACSVKDCGWWIGPWDETREVDAMWGIIEHLALHVANPKYRWKDVRKSK